MGGTRLGNVGGLMGGGRGCGECKGSGTNFCILAHPG